MPLAVADIVQVRVICDIPGEVAINVRHYRVSAIAGASRSELQVANALHPIYGAVYGPIMNTTARFFNLEVAKIYPLPVGATAFSTGIPTGGSITGDMLPPQVCGIITLRTALGGRAHRGRAYIPYPSESQNTALGLPTTGHKTALDSIATMLGSDQVIVSGADSCTLKPIVWHRVTKTYTDVTSTVGRTYWATQRRRTNAAF